MEFKRFKELSKKKSEKTEQLSEKDSEINELKKEVETLNKRLSEPDKVTQKTETKEETPIEKIKKLSDEEVNELQAIAMIKKQGGTMGFE